MTRKTFISASLVLAMATVTGAAERTRTADSPSIAPGTTDVVRPEYREIAPGVVVANINGSEFTIRQDGSIALDEVIETFGSAAKYTLEADLANVPMSTSTDGTRIFANGTVGYFRDMVANSEPSQNQLWTIEDLKDMFIWGERAVGEDVILAFANGIVTTHADVNWDVPRQSQLQSVPYSLDADGNRVYANGAIFDGDTPELTSGN